MKANAVIKFRKWITTIYQFRPRTGPMKLWCYYGDPYRMALATTLGLAALFIAIIILILVVGTVGALIVGLAGLVLGALYYGLIVLGGLSGFLVLKEGGEGGCVAPVITIAIAAGIYYGTKDSVHKGLQGLFDTAGDVISYMAKPAIHTWAFVSDYWPGITTVILAPVVLIGGIAGVLMLVVGIAHAIEWVVIKRYGIRYPCPVCAHPSEPARYFCDKCNLEHETKLVPGPYGVFHHKCAHCPNTLPTMMLLGRNKTLAHKCGTCGNGLNDVVGTDKHIAFIGGRSAGKTCLLVQSTRTLLTQPSAEIIETEQKEAFLQLEQQVMQGNPPAQTQRKVDYRAFQVLLPAGAFPYHVHLYDIAGEAFENGVEAGNYPFYRTLDAVIFLVDPTWSKDFRDRHGIDTRVAYANQDPLETYFAMQQAFERHRQKGSRLPVFFFLLVKTDLGYLPNVELEEASLEHFMQAEAELAPLIATARTYFGTVRYLAATALGRIPSTSDHRAFDFDGLRKPIEVIFKSINIKF